MVNKKVTSRQQGAQRKIYSAPVLTRFGAIKDLTAGGTGGPEMAMMNMAPARRA